MKEYGSDFIIAEPIGELNKIYANDIINEYLLGRTALDAIIQDAIKTKKIKKVMLPSYCCHTMIAPFAKHGLEIEFYDIFTLGSGIEYCIEENASFDAILIMQYFGFYNANFFDLIKKWKARGKIIIEDATHSILQLRPYSEVSDYVFVSYRKWMATNGGAIVKKRNGSITTELVKDAESARDKYLRLKKKAVEEKKRYFADGAGGTKNYLSIFQQAEETIENEYAGFQIDSDSQHAIRYTDYNRIKVIRRENAKYLLGELAGISRIKRVFTSIDEQDCPLFVPILLKREDRADMRQFLIKKNVFLPMHWPVSNLHKLTNRAKQFYDEEISIVCDQRYTVEDMAYIINQIKEWAE